MSFRAWISMRRESGWHGFRNQPAVILSEAKADPSLRSG